MVEHDDKVLIRALFDRAMENAPPAPSLDDIAHQRVFSQPQRDAGLRRRATLMAAAGVIAAAAVAVTIIVGGRDRTQTVATAGPTVDSPTLSTPSTQAPLSEPLAGRQTSIVIARDDGLTVEGSERAPVQMANAPVAAAYGASDGRVFLLASLDGDAGGGTAKIHVWDTASGIVEALDVPNPTGGALTLHDVATIDGIVTVLYEYGPDVCNVETDECDSSLAVYEPDTGRSTGLVTLNLARNQWVTLSLADTGLVVGELRGPEGNEFYSGLAGAEVRAVNPQAADLGLSPSLAECTNCPRSFTTDSSGRYISWREGPDIVAIDLLDPEQRATARNAVPDLGPSSDELTMSVDRLVFDGSDIVGGVASFTTPDRSSSAVIDLANSSSQQLYSGVATLY